MNSTRHHTTPITLFLALIAGVVGGLMGISDFEGGRGMLAAWGIRPLGGLSRRPNISEADA